MVVVTISIVTTTTWIVATITIVAVTSELVTTTILVCCGHINKLFVEATKSFLENVVVKIDCVVLFT